MTALTESVAPLEAHSTDETNGAWVTVATIAALVVVGGVIPILLARRYGALDIPRSDAWSYLRTLFHWQRTGHWDFNNWVSMTLVGQVFLALPIVAVFGRSILAVNLAFAVLGVAGLILLLRFGAIFGLSRAQQAFLALLMAACPMWGSLVPTYMTDVPAFVFEILALTIAGAALGRPNPSMRLLTASVIVALFGVSIRQYGAVPLVAILATAYLHVRAQRDQERVRAVVLLSVFSAVAFFALLAWWRTVPNAKALAPGMPTLTTLKKAYIDFGGFLRLAGIMLAPAALFAGPTNIVKRAFRADRRISLALLTGAILLMSTGYSPNRPFVGNYFSPRGVLGDDIVLPGLRPKVMPSWAFGTLIAIATISALVLVLAMVPWLAEVAANRRADRRRAADPRLILVGSTLGAFAIGYELAIATGLPMFDRYALPTFPLIAVLLLRSASARRATDTAPPTTNSRLTPRLAFAALVALALIGVAMTAESASFDGTRWKLGQMAVARGYSHVQIDAGYEWVGWFRGAAQTPATTKAAKKKARVEYYVGLCVSVYVDAKKMPPHAIAQAWSHAPTRRPSLFVVYQNKRPCSLAPDSLGP